MEVYPSLEGLTGRFPDGSAVAWGVFDGVHRGHRAILGAVVEEARRFGGAAVALTFPNHPAAFLWGSSVPMLSTLAQRLRRLAASGLDAAVTQPFDASFAARSAEEFVDGILRGSLAARAVVVGPDTRFGRDRSGDERLLLARGAAGGFGVRRVEPLLDGGERVSSTRIRRLVAAGGVAEAARLLGRFFAYEGKVVAGDRRGRSIGFPTANLAPGEEGQICPARGVYAGRAEVEGRTFPAAVNVGLRPTFSPGGPPPVVEAHLAGFAGDLYGRSLEVEFLERLREERRFGSAEELALQIRRDVADAVERSARFPTPAF